MSAAVAPIRSLKGLPPSLPRLRVVDGAPVTCGDGRFRILPKSTPLDGIPWVEARALADLERELEWRAREHTQEEIAARLGLTQGRISQIERRALRKMLALTCDDWAEDTVVTMHKALGSPFATDGRLGTLTNAVRK